MASNADSSPSTRKRSSSAPSPDGAHRPETIGPVPGTPNLYEFSTSAASRTSLCLYTYTAATSPIGSLIRETSRNSYSDSGYLTEAFARPEGVARRERAALRGFRVPSCGHQSSIWR